MGGNNKILFQTALLIFAVLLFRLFQLQIIEGGKYQRTAMENAAKVVPAPAPRGVIFDRRGEIMVENRPLFSVQVLPQVLFEKHPEIRDKIFDRLSAILGKPMPRRLSGAQSILVKDNVDLAAAMKIEEQKSDLDGVVVSVKPIRSYPRKNLAAHLLGYVGEIESADLNRLKIEGYRLGDSIGKDGLEKFYDKGIRGIDGGKKIEVDVYGQPTRLLETLDPVPGANVKLTIDLPLQAAAEKALAGKAGAIVVIDPNSGEVLALASSPSYDPNVFLEPIDNLKWRALSGGRHPFMNRALAIYPPGSIFKVITLTAVLEEGLAKPEEVFNCPGYYNLNGRIAKCWKENGHGRITLKEGLTQSCDIVFYEMGRRLGPERLARYARLYGLGDRTGIDIPQEKKGLVPTEAWKKEVWKEPWYEGDNINYGIGQGYLQVTPLQMALVYGTIATGKRVRPFVVSEIKDREGKIVYRGEPKVAALAPLSQEHLKVIRGALYDVVDRATGRAAKIEGLPAAGKTGTAQNPGLPHAWFLCYAPFNNPEIVIASFVEHGEHGDRAAAYVARDILKWYKENRLNTGTREAGLN